MQLMAGLASYLLARKSLAPIASMTAQAERISAENLDQRLQEKNNGDELGKMARVFNELLARIESSFEGMRQFTAGASHELRTPLAIIRGEAGVALSQGGGPGESRGKAGIMRDCA